MKKKDTSTIKVSILNNLFFFWSKFPDCINKGIATIEKKIIQTFESIKETIEIDNLLIINCLLNKENVSNLFSEIITYDYIIKFINKVNETIDIKTKKKLKDNLILILESKIIIKLIDIYEKTDKYNKDNEEKQLEEERKKMKDIFENEDIIDSFLQPNLHCQIEDLIEKYFTEIYFDIISELINSKKNGKNVFEEIIEKSDLKIISNNNKELLLPDNIIALIEKKDFVKRIEIVKKEDLSNKEKINFYYYFLQYLLKNRSCIYQIPFLRETRKLFLKLLRNNELFFNNEKEEYVITTIIDNKYYFKQISEHDIDKLNTILNYYIKALFESKKDEIKKIKIIIKNKWGKYKNYMNDYDEAEKNNLILSIIYCGLKNEIKNDEKKIRKYIETFENSIREKKTEKIGKDDLHRLLIFFREIKNKESFIKVFNEEIYEYTINYATAYLILDDSTFIFYSNNNDNDESKYKFGNYGYNLLTNLENIKIYFTKIDKDSSTLKNNFIQLYNYLINIEEIIKNNKALSSVLNVKVEFKLENNNIYNSIRNAKITPYTRFGLSDDELNNIIEIITKDNNLMISRNDKIWKKLGIKN